MESIHSFSCSHEKKHASCSLKFCLLGSGSSGNALLISANGSKILIDNGLSYRQLEQRTAAVGESLDGLQAVFVTHEHMDHVGGLGVLTRRREVPVYMTQGTHERLPSSIGRLNQVHLFESGETILFDCFAIRSFSVSHDAADPVSFVVKYGPIKLGIAADLGHVSKLVRTCLSGVHALVLESNYCPDMLRDGSYPPQIQQRIRGSHGHLSNPDAMSLLSSLLHDGLQTVVLTHISQENNTPDRALRMAKRVVEGRSITVHVAHQDKPSPVFEISP